MELEPPLELVNAWAMAVGATYPRHRHDEMELVYHRNGAGFEVLAAGVRLRFGPGSVTHLPAGTLHGEHDQAGSIVVCVLARWRVRPPPTLRRPWASPPGADPWLDREFTWLGSAAWRRSEATRREAGFRLIAILAHLAAGRVVEPVSLLRAPGARVAEAQRWIRTHLRAATVAGAARIVGVSADHLNRLFRADCNYGPRHAIAQARIDRAKEMLTTTSLPLQAIAGTVGFASARHFCQAFRRVAGTTPGRFRDLGSHLALTGSIFRDRQPGRHGIECRQRFRRHCTRAIAASRSSAPNAGHAASVKWIFDPALCHNRKFDTRRSPLVRTSTSTGGSSGR